MSFTEDDLFKQMKGDKPNSQNTAVGASSLLENTVSNKVDKFGFNYYKILDVDKDTSISDIKKRYRKLLAKYHPDKFTSLTDKERKLKEKQFQLVQIAGKILTDEDSKKMYDLEQKTIKSKSFVATKSTFDDFIKLQEAGVTEEGKKRAQLDFVTETKKMNKQRGFDPSKIDDRMDRSKLDKEIDDLKVRRDMEFIEISQQNVFEGRQFNPSEFNKLFEKNKKKQDKNETKKKEKGEIVKFGEEFTAFNDNGLENFIPVDSDYSNPFGSDNFRENSLFGNINNHHNDIDSDISSVDSNYDDGYNNHNVDRDLNKTEDRLKQMMRERESLDINLKNKDTAGYKDVMNDQFGISKQFGKMIGKDITQKNKKHTDDKDMVKIYNKMISHDSDSDSD